MRVLQINNFHYIKGGADRVYFNTSELLEKNGHNVIHFSSSNAENLDSGYSRFFISLKDNRKNSFINRFLGAGEYLYNRNTYRNIEGLIKLTKPDIAHLHLFYGGITASVLRALKKNKIPIIQTIHDYRLLCPANAFLNKHGNICEKCKNRFYLQCTIERCLENNLFFSMILSLEAYIRKYFINPLDYVDHFIFVSRFSREKHIEFNPAFLNKSSLLYNFSIIPETIKSSQKGRYLLFFGRLSKEKGLLTLLDAIQDTQVILKIVGAGPLQKDVEEYVRKNKNIEFLGYKSGEDLRKVIEEAMFIIVPSEWYENNPMTVIEAYSLGVPVIASDSGGLPEIVKDSVTGYIFKSRDKADLQKVIMQTRNINNDEYFSMSTRAKKFAEDYFSPQPHYSKLVRLYSEIIDGR